MATISIFILVIFGVTGLAALIALLVYYARYRRHISRVMNGEEASSDKRISSPSETALSVLIILLLVWNGFSLVQFSIVNNELNDMEYRMTQISRDLTIYSNEINDQISRSGSLVREAYFVQNEIDKAKREFVMDFEVRLKEFSDSTEVYLNYDNQRIRMEKDGDKFTASANIRLGECVYDFATVEIINNGITRIDTLDDTPTGPVWKDFLPQVYASKLPWEIKQKNGKVEIKDEMKFRMVERSENIHMTAAYLVTEINGTEIERQPISLSSYDDEYTIKIAKTYDLKSTDILTFYTITETDLGLSYKSLMVTYGGEDVTENNVSAEQLLDSDGSVLYSE